MVRDWFVLASTAILTTDYAEDSAMKLMFRVHAVQSMFERRVSRDDVWHVLIAGEVIERYSDDTPYPSRLVLGWVGGRALHVVAADIPETDETVIITVYEPDPRQWEHGFRRRRR